MAYTGRMPLDIGIGLLGAVLQALLGGEDLTASLLLLSVLFVLLPDLDGLVSAVRKGSLAKVDHTHRDLLHRPIPYLAVGGAIVWLMAPQYLLLFLTMSLAHFIHDSIGIGWGIPWLTPFSRGYLKLFSDKDGDASRSFVFWRPEEREAVIARRHDPDWMRHQYGRPSATLVAEGAALLLALAVAYLATRWL